MKYRELMSVAVALTTQCAYCIEAHVDNAVKAGATREEIEFLQRLRFKEKRPTALYYYRELQSLRDPLHFRGGGRRVKE